MSNVSAELFQLCRIVVHVIGPAAKHDTVQLGRKSFRGLMCHLLPLGAVFQDARSVVNGPVVFAYGEVRAFVLIHLNHQIVVLQLGLLKAAQEDNYGMKWHLKYLHYDNNTM